MSLAEFYTNNNPYADKGYCVDITATSYEMTSTKAGLFRILWTSEMVYIEFDSPFRGRTVEGTARIEGVYSITNVPHLRMLEIEK